MKETAWKWWNCFVHAVSFEFLLGDQSNSGSVVLLRSALTALVLLIFSIIMNTILDNGISLNVQPNLIWRGLQAHPTWYPLVFAAVYTGLYTRYASQWQYLAKLYNDIKGKQLDLALRSDLPAPALECLAVWKAGFIADANAMHLATQESYATVIGDWLNDTQVRSAYLSANSTEAFQSLVARLKEVDVEVTIAQPAAS